jgi:hypothetical protein
MHVGEEVAVVTSIERKFGVPFTVVLKTFRRRGARSASPVANGVIAAACRARRTPLAVYCGFSSKTAVRGIALPERFKPSPLNLCVSSRPPGFIDLPSFVYSTFEFFEFDAY